MKDAYNCKVEWVGPEGPPQTFRCQVEAYSFSDAQDLARKRLKDSHHKVSRVLATKALIKRTEPF